jgi:hypothetical protein
METIWLNNMSQDFSEKRLMLISQHLPTIVAPFPFFISSRLLLQEAITIVLW